MGSPQFDPQEPGPFKEIECKKYSLLMHRPIQLCILCWSGIILSDLCKHVILSVLLCDKLNTIALLNIDMIKFMSYES